VSLGDTLLLDRVFIDKIAPSGEVRERIGFSTWGPTPRIKAIELLR
jgi:hypothetical protein